MAFDVTPTSGDAPYNFTATIESDMLIDNVKYSISLRSSGGSGTCPAEGTTTNIPIGATSLLESGSYTVVDSVPADVCRAYTLSIRDIETNTVISTATVQISNIE